MDKSRLDYPVGFYNRKKSGVHLGGLSFICIKIVRVTEARQRSGTSITVEMALEQGREIYAVPGRITDRLSDGCNKMLKEGAHVFLSPEDFLLDLDEMLSVKMSELKKKQLKDYEMSVQVKNNIIKNKTDEGVKLSEHKDDSLGAMIIKVLDFYPQSVEIINEKLNKEYHIEVKREELTGELMMLCLMGEIKQYSSSWFSRIR